MKIIGLTGGIGSGKSTVSKILLNHNIPVYDSDSKAKKLMNSSNAVSYTHLTLPTKRIV